MQFRRSLTKPLPIKIKIKTSEEPRSTLSLRRKGKLDVFSDEN